MLQSLLPSLIQCPCPAPQVGWPHKNVVRELLREPAGVSLVLKKVPVPESPPQVLAVQPCPPACFQTLVASSITLFLFVPQTPPQAGRGCAVAGAGEAPGSFQLFLKGTGASWEQSRALTGQSRGQSWRQLGVGAPVRTAAEGRT